MYLYELISRKHIETIAHDMPSLGGSQRATEYYE
jgi:hypothetical protein